MVWCFSDGKLFALTCTLEIQFPVGLCLWRMDKKALDSIEQKFMFVEAARNPRVHGAASSCVRKMSDGLHTPPPMDYSEIPFFSGRQVAEVWLKRFQHYTHGTNWYRIAFIFLPAIIRGDIFSSVTLYLPFVFG